MNRNTIFLSCAMLTTLVVVADNASASVPQANRDSFYIEAKGGVSLPNKPKGDFPRSKLKQSNNFEARVGYHFHQNVDADIGLSYIPRYKLTSQTVGDDSKTAGFDFLHRSKVRSTSVMINGYYNIPSLGALTPYVGVGGGIARNKLADTVVTYSVGNINNAPFKIKRGASNTNFAWQLMAGVRFRLNECLELTGEYKYMDLGKIKTGSQYVSSNAGYAPVGTVVQGEVQKGKLRSNNVLVGLRYSF